ncbi:MAG TPA: endonuclease [Candidatus Thermoplasmatota archaeon]|nr:endonuclease [Candidatus Thermoplasmatota archaeon]
MNHFGHQHWWPINEQYHEIHGSDPRFEIIIGAILTQNTAWSNVEKALERLREHHALTAESIAHLTLRTLKNLIQPSGFFNQKAQRLKTISSHLLQEYQANLTFFFSRDAPTIRRELLDLNGIGPETADSILLYAGDKPAFVIDAYTRRISRRLPLTASTESYDELQGFFVETLQKRYPKDQLVPVYQELHALMVELAKNYCRATPRCDQCPLTRSCKKVL